jgi:hypothetical protein
MLKYLISSQLSLTGLIILFSIPIFTQASPAKADAFGSSQVFLEFYFDLPDDNVCTAIGPISLGPRILVPPSFKVGTGDYSASGGGSGALGCGTLLSGEPYNVVSESIAIATASDPYGEALIQAQQTEVGGFENYNLAPRTITLFPQGFIFLNARADPDDSSTASGIGSIFITLATGEELKFDLVTDAIKNDNTLSKNINYLPITFTLAPAVLGIPSSTTISLNANAIAYAFAKVPEPTSTLSLLALGTLGAASTLKRKLKPSKSTEKETTKVG